MAKMSSQPLQPNPFITYRDPNTGLWLIVSGDTVGEERSRNRENAALAPATEK